MDSKSSRVLAQGAYKSGGLGERLVSTDEIEAVGRQVAKDQAKN